MANLLSAWKESYMPTAKIKRADGRYQVSVTVGRKPDGSREQKYFYGETQAKAKAKRDKWLEERKKQLDPTRDAVPVKSWAERWLSVYATGGYSAQQGHRSHVALINEHLGKKVLAKVVHADIQEFAKSCAGFSKSYVLKIKRDLSSIFDTAIANHLIEKSPCDKIKWEHAGEEGGRFLESWERDLIRENWQVQSAGVWAMLMLYAGLRPGEALALS